MSQFPPSFWTELRLLQRQLLRFVAVYQQLDSTTQKKQYLAKTKQYIALLQDIKPVVQQASLHAPCPPENIPASVRKHDKPEGIQIFKSRVAYIYKYKADYEQYFINCLGIQLGWKNGLPSPNVGQKYTFEYINHGRFLIIYPKQLTTRSSNTGHTQLQAKLQEYRALENQIRHSLLEENIQASLVQTIDLERLIELELLLKESLGGLNDLYDNILKDPELKQQYQKMIERIRKDWSDNGRMTALKREVEKKLEQRLERDYDSPCPNEDPEPKPAHETELNAKDFSQLPLFQQGAGDSAAVDLNDIDQGATGDCYYLASVGALAKMKPELFQGEQAIIKKNGAHYEVILHLREDRNSKKRTPTRIRVSANVLVDKDGKPKYQGLADNELWAIILEKAYAQVFGGV